MNIAFGIILGILAVLTCWIWIPLLLLLVPLFLGLIVLVLTLIIDLVCTPINLILALCGKPANFFILTKKWMSWDGNFDDDDDDDDDDDGIKISHNKISIGGKNGINIKAWNKF